MSSSTEQFGFAILRQVSKKSVLYRSSAREISTSFSFKADGAHSLRTSPTGRWSVSLSIPIMNLRSSTSAIASVCARENSSLTASKTVVRPTNTACATSLARRFSDSDARRSINVSVHDASICWQCSPKMIVVTSPLHSSSHQWCFSSSTIGAVVPSFHREACP